jgi:hypothetical protein
VRWPPSELCQGSGPRRGRTRGGATSAVASWRAPPWLRPRRGRTRGGTASAVATRRAPPWPWPAERTHTWWSSKRDGLSASSAMATAPREDAHTVKQQARWPPGELRHGRGPRRGRARGGAASATASRRTPPWPRKHGGLPRELRQGHASGNSITHTYVYFNC